MLELFEQEPNIIFDKECGVVHYNKVDSRGLSLYMLISIYENQCKIDLNKKIQEEYSSIFSIDMHDVIEIKGTKEYLTICRESERNVKIYFKPNFIIEFENF